MNGADRLVHDHALRLVAAQIDFDLAEGELEELRAHLDACPACRRDAGAMPGDTARLAFAVYPALPSRRVDDAVYAEIAHRRRPAGSPLVLVAATLLLVALLGVAAAGAFLLRDAQPDAVVPTPPPGDVVAPSQPPDGSPPPSSPSPEPGWTAVPGTLPVASGTVQMAPGPYGGLYVVVDSEGESVVALLDAAGSERPGWPTALPGWSCDAPNPDAAWSPGVAPDGSVRILCYRDGTPGEDVTAFAFDAEGRPFGGWPVALPDDIAGAPRTVDGTLLVPVREAGDGGDSPGGTFRLLAVGADGTVRDGARLDVADATGGIVSIGPDGIAYLLDGNEITAFDLDGILGSPARVDGNVSNLAFDRSGRVHVTSSAGDGTTRLLHVDAAGRVRDAGPGDLPIAGASAWSGAGPAGRPIAPLVGGDGTTYVVGEADGEAVVYGINAAGAIMDGWPYRDPAPLPWQGSCPEGSTGCGVRRATPAVGDDGTLYLPVAAVGPAAGGSVVAIGRDGRVVPGWPVGLRRSGADFWSVVAASGQTAFALAVEPEQGSGSSATILDIAIDSAVRYRATVVGPAPR